MTLDEEIKYAKIEKQFNEAVDVIMSELDFDSCNEEADVLNLKYSEAAELINNYNFKESIAEYVKAKEFSKEDAVLLSEILDEKYDIDGLYAACKKAQVVCEGAKAMIEKSNKKSIMESYDVLSRIYVFLEGRTKIEDNPSKSKMANDAYDGVKDRVARLVKKFGEEKYNDVMKKLDDDKKIAAMKDKSTINK